MNTTILEQLTQIEEKNAVKVLYALESGSRAWGFASRNSDYDVRFIYIHHPDWYLSIRDRRDVIECPISNDLDISGWDLRKALGLFSKSNPPLLEWLGSPIIYKDDYGLADKLRAMLITAFQPNRSMYHYLHMARGNYREYLKGEVVRLKKYLYVLRPILACLWIEKHGTMPPTEFSKLVCDARLSVTLNAAIDELLARKMSGDELDTAQKVPVLNEFIEQMLDHYSLLSGKRPTPVADYDALDQLFREMLQSVWGNTL
jgi:predicted nucleotidyltransferase